MALISDIVTRHGLELENAYLTIEKVEGNEVNLNVTLLTYISKETFDNGDAPIDSNVYSFVPSVDVKSDNFIKQGYDHLLTLPFLAGARNA